MISTPLHRLACTVALLMLVTWLGGCAGLPSPADFPMPKPAPSLSAGEQEKLGAAIEARLLQLLGGPYHDRRLVADLDRLPAGRALRISVADRSAAALYALPGGRVVVTRGLLAGLGSRAELEGLLARAASLTGVAAGNLPRGAGEAVAQLLAGQESPYDPEGAAIRLARLYEQAPCAGECLTAAPAGRAGQGGLPESIGRLATLAAGYRLQAEAREYELKGAAGKAIATYLQAATAAPDEPNILGALGLAYLRAGQLQPARMHLEKAVRLQPDYYRTLMGLGYLHLGQERPALAGEPLAASVRLLPVGENLFLLAESRERSGDNTGAMALYRQVAASDRDGKLGRLAAERLAGKGTTQ